MKKLFSFNKTEKLKSRKALEHLFSKGKTFLVHPYKVYYSIADAEENLIHCGVGVSKKNFGKAVQRNRIKRLMREAYRLNKTDLYHIIENKQLDFFILFIDKTMPLDFNYLSEKMQKTLSTLQQQYLNELAK